jgi:ABC-type uncharacterized transport system ATPase component
MEEPEITEVEDNCNTSTISSDNSLTNLVVLTSHVPKLLMRMEQAASMNPNLQEEVWDLTNKVLCKISFIRKLGF